MEGEDYQIVNWKIVNFSCWNKDLHGECIESSDICFDQYYLTMKLYPRGTSGLNEHMVVHFSFHNYNDDFFSGGLSFIGADGSTLCKQRVHFKKDVKYFELPGPKFEEVAVQREVNESDRMDQLFLRLQIKTANRYDQHHVCTIFQVFDVTMEVDRSAILKEHEFISEIRNNLNGCDTFLLLKTGDLREDKKMELNLRSNIDCDSKTQFSVKTNFSLISSEGSTIRNEKKEHLFHINEREWTFLDSLSKEELSENARLILNFKIITGKVCHTLRNVYFYFDDVKVISSRYISVCMENSHTHSAIDHTDQGNSSRVLSKELRGLYQDQDFSDLQLICESVSFPVHKAILSARSTVFKTMLSSDMTEAATDCVDIADLEAPTLARFLAFLYTGAVEDLQGESALKLYYAAYKYDVPSLKRECVSFLSANVCVSDVCDVLLFGYKHQDDELIAVAHDFILRNFNAVLKSKEWKSFMGSEPLLAVKTVTDFAEKDFFKNLNPL